MGDAHSFGSGAGIRTQDPSVTRNPNISIRSGLYHSRPFFKGYGTRGFPFRFQIGKVLSFEIVSEPFQLFYKKGWTWLLIAISSCGGVRVPVPIPLIFQATSESRLIIGTIHLVIHFSITWEGCNRPAWLSLWQLEQTRTHLSSSFLVFVQERVKPFCPSPKSFPFGLRWWNSKAPT